MKITGIDCHVLVVPDLDTGATSSAQDDIVVVVHTDEGITGFGETDVNPWIAKACIEAPGTHTMGLGLKEMLLGENPLEPERIWDKLYTGSAMNGRRGALILLSSLPAAACALLLERPIERRLGTPATVAAGLLLGSAAMVAADGAPQDRGREEAGARDALWLGVAQATALVPGVSRNGATLVAARLRRFRREDANVLSRHVALPIILAASVLKGKRLARRGLPRGARRAFAAGVALVRAVRKNRRR